MHSNKTISKQIEGDLHTISYNDRMAILDKYFPNSSVDLGHVDDALALNTLLRLEDEGIYQNHPLTTTQSNTSRLSLNVALLVLGTLGFLNPDQALKTYNTNNNLLSAAIHTPLVRRVIIDKSGY